MHSVREGLGAGIEPSGAWLRPEGASLSRPGWGLGADSNGHRQPRVPVGDGGFLSVGLWTKGHLGGH